MNEEQIGLILIAVMAAIGMVSANLAWISVQDLKQTVLSVEENILNQTDSIHNHISYHCSE
jgi:uncharacterized membrane protein